MKKQHLVSSIILSIIVVIIIRGFYQKNEKEKIQQDITSTSTHTLTGYFSLLLGGCERDEEILAYYQEEIEIFNATHNKIQLQLLTAKITDENREEKLHIGQHIGGFDNTCGNYKNKEQAKEAVVINIQYYKYYEDPLRNIIGTPCDKASDIRFKESNLVLKACNEGAEKVGDEGQLYIFDDAQTVCKGGYYLPSKTDWEMLLSTLQLENNAVGSKGLQITLRKYITDLPDQINMDAYRSSTAKEDDIEGDLLHQAYYLLISEGLAMLSSDGRNHAFSVRCFYNDQIFTVYQ